MNTEPTTLTGTLDFLGRLTRAKIHYEISAPTYRAIMVSIAVPGERWEVELHEDGEISVETFVSKGVKGSECLDDLFARFSD